MTKDGIEYDFNITPYKVEKVYSGLKLTFYFSSSLYMQKFKLNWSNFKISKLEKIGLNFDFRMIQDLYNYCVLEKRGFRIDYENITGNTVSFNRKRFNSIDEIKIECLCK